MKTQRNLLIALLVVSLASTSDVLASDYSPGSDPGAVVVDTVLVRPVCLAATILGSAFFIISLPVAATSRSVRRAAQALVVKPAQATFTRPLGDFDEMTEYY